MLLVCQANNYVTNVWMDFRLRKGKIGAYQREFVMLINFRMVKVSASHVTYHATIVHFPPVRVVITAPKDFINL